MAFGFKYLHFLAEVNPRNCSVRFVGTGGLGYKVQGFLPATILSKAFKLYFCL